MSEEALLQVSPNVGLQTRRLRRQHGCQRARIVILVTNRAARGAPLGGGGRRPCRSSRCRHLSAAHLCPDPPQEVQAPWEFASQLEQGDDSAVCTVRELLAAKKEEVLRTLQRQVRPAGFGALPPWQASQHLY